MMRVAFDFQTFALQEYGGISRYFCKLASQLSSGDGAVVKIFAPLHINAYLAALAPELVFGRKVRRLPKTARLLFAANDFLMKAPLSRFQPHVLHETYYAPRSHAPKGARRVVTVYDMIHERYAATFSRKDRTSENKRRAVKDADHVICISHHTRKDLLELVDLPEERVSTVHLGFDPLVGSAGRPNPLPELMGGAPYVLYVGYRGEYKNFDGLLRAFAASPVLKNNFRLVCFGGGGFQDEERQRFAALGLAASQVVQISGGDEKLVDCYRGAAAFVYPSLYEGFGIPPLEAMALDCPVLCGRTSSIPEVVGDAGEYFDPTDTASIGGALERVLNSDARRSELIEKGRKRFPLFSWERTAKETLKIYQDLT